MSPEEKLKVDLVLAAATTCIKLGLILEEGINRKHPSWQGQEDLIDVSIKMSKDWLSKYEGGIDAI
jgi:hypothetical protein